ncbi:MAG: hypothetical protein R3C31_12390 [Hyphomonadaceae bacterium]
MKAIEAQTCVEAWLAACDYLTQSDDAWRAYNVVLEIAEPLKLGEDERAVVGILDQFLTDRGGMPFNTVVNTIFPAQLYQRHGAEGVYERYLSEVYPQIEKHPDCSWGTYAQRILCRTDALGETIYPLRDLVNKLKGQLQMSGPNRAVYELGLIDPFMDIPIYDPAQDRTRPIGGPCLSHLSFKLGPDRRLHLTALYRSHWYVQRALGNLFGLAHLLHFVADEAGLKLGSLICLSSMAQLDTKPKAWGKGDVKTLLAQFHAAKLQADAA